MSYWLLESGRFLVTTDGGGPRGLAEKSSPKKRVAVSDRRSGRTFRRKQVEESGRRSGRSEVWRSQSEWIADGEGAD